MHNVLTKILYLYNKNDLQVSRQEARLNKTEWNWTYIGKKQKQVHKSNEDENEATWLLFPQHFIDELKWQRIKNRGKIDATSHTNKK